jgi:VCBS repeat-containing protein
MKNNIVQGSSISDYSGTTGTTANNIAKDTSSPDSIQATLTFANAGSYNYALASTDTAAIGKGTNLSGTFTVDITGATRSTWDIGAFYYASAAPVNHGFTRFLN